MLDQLWNAANLGSEGGDPTGHALHESDWHPLGVAHVEDQVKSLRLKMLQNGGRRYLT
jgi:hypothetical protein